MVRVGLEFCLIGGELDALGFFLMGAVFDSIVFDRIKKCNRGRFF